MLFKAVTKSGGAPIASGFMYDLPKNGVEGAWTSSIYNLDPCKSGYHVVEDADLFRGNWVRSGYRIFQCEKKGQSIAEDHKVVCESIRLVKEYKWNRDIAISAGLAMGEHITNRHYPKNKSGNLAVLDILRKNVASDSKSFTLFLPWSGNGLFNDFWRSLERLIKKSDVLEFNKLFQLAEEMTRSTYSGGGWVWNTTRVFLKPIEQFKIVEERANKTMLTVVETDGKRSISNAAILQEIERLMVPADIKCKECGHTHTKRNSVRVTIELV